MDVISTVTHAIVSHVAVPDPRGIDISPDDSTVWVGTGSRQMFAIHTADLTVTRYLLPPGPAFPESEWEGSDRVQALADGSLLFRWAAVGVPGIAIWNPATNAIAFPNTPNAADADMIDRSGDGKRVYFIAGDSSGDVYYYDVAAKTFSAVAQLGSYAGSAAVNMDGSRLVICDYGGSNNMYDGNLSLVSPLPPCSSGPLFSGGSVFSPDGQYIYQEILSSLPVILKLDISALKIASISPAMPMIPVMTELDPPYYVPVPFAVDSTGMVFGIEDWGIALDDGAFSQDLSIDEPGTPTFLQHMDPYFGPVTGGTASGGFGNSFSLTPDVWYGANRGTASLASGGLLTITSPPATKPGPVNIKMLFPDGIEVFDPLFFAYGPDLQYALVSGGPPQGGVSAQIVGYGLPGDTQGTLTIGGATATLQQPSGSNGLPFAGTPFPNKLLGYTVPSGTPGWADITVTTPDGTSTLPKSFFYAKSVTDYPSTDSFTAVLYDAKRQQLYLSAGDHIDVFSLVSNQFTTPLDPPAVGSSKLFAGLALTPDGGLLLAADLQDGSLAVVNPDNPGSGYAIPIAPVGTNGNASCAVGPLYVAATSTNQAMVVTGGIPAIGCGPGGQAYLADLTAKTAGPPPASPTCTMLIGGIPGHVSATSDGTRVAIGGSSGYSGFCIYDPVAKTYVSNSAGQAYGAEFSADGQVAASQMLFTDASANVIGKVAWPVVFSAPLGGPGSLLTDLQNPQLNDSGSLYYVPYAHYIDILDTLHGMLRLRFSLSETVSNTAAPMAIDSSGRFIYLITDQGLTIVDLGEAPIAIGWLNPSAASVGAQITVRGSGFDSSTTATVNGKAAMVSVVDPSTLDLSIPSVSSGPATIVLKNGDGITYTASGLLTIQ